MMVQASSSQMTTALHATHTQVPVEDWYKTLDNGTGMVLVKDVQDLP